MFVRAKSSATMRGRSPLSSIDPPAGGQGRCGRKGMSMTRDGRSFGLAVGKVQQGHQRTVVGGVEQAVRFSGTSLAVPVGPGGGWRVRKSGRARSKHTRRTPGQVKTARLDLVTT